jgi:DNA-binding NtrC family response regulator
MDDDDQVRRLVTRALRGDGHAVAEAPNGIVGLRLLREMPIDLVITDILMPEQDGLETITEILRVRPSLPIIAISGGGVGSGGAYLSLAMTLGAKCVLEKPFEVARLIALVRDIADAPPLTVKPDDGGPR